MTMRPDPTFHASPKLAMEAPPESFAYTLLLSPDFSKPDALAVIDVKPGSPTFSQVVHTVVMPNKGDEFHHFGWNACSSALSPLTGHAFLERRYLIIPGIRSSRIYIVDTKPDPTNAAQQEWCEPGFTLLCMGLFSRFFVQALPCTAEGALGRVGYTRSLGQAVRRADIRSGRSRRGALACDRNAGSLCQREFLVSLRRHLVASFAIGRSAAAIARDNAGLFALDVGIDSGHP
jgi:hypothetical protein